MKSFSFLLLTKLFIGSLVIFNWLLLQSSAQSGDGDFNPLILDGESDSEEQVVETKGVKVAVKDGGHHHQTGHDINVNSAVSDEDHDDDDDDDSFVTEASSLDIYIAEDVNGTSHDNSSVTFVVHNGVGGDKGVGGGGKSFISSSAMGPIILVIVLVVLLIFGCCSWRILALRKKRRRSLRLRNHALASQLSETEKGSRELVEIKRHSPLYKKEEVQPLSEKEIRLEAEGSLPFNPPLPVTFTTFKTMATVSRLSPPPSYEEYLHASREQINDERSSMLSDLGPSYR